MLRNAMNDRPWLLLAAALLLTTGCDSSGQTDTSGDAAPPPSDASARHQTDTGHDGHDHSPGEGHDHSPGDGHDHAAGDGHDHPPGDGHDHAAGDGHDHHGHDGPARPPGPNGGRVIAGFQPSLEFLVTDERRVRITFLGETGQPVPAAGQVVTVVAGDRANPTRLSFARDGASLLSSGPLPEGGLMPVIVSVAQGDGARPVRERFNLNLATCPGCSQPEYACTCGS